MQVFLVEAEYYYEGSQVLGIFSSKEKAQKYIDNIERKFADNYNILEEEIDYYEEK